MSWGEIYNTSWWGVALDTARTVKARPDFFGSQLNLLTSEQPNLVVNGTFDTDSDWNKETGWSISGGKLLGTSVTTGLAYQNNIVQAGKRYKATYDAVVTSGSIGLYFDGGTGYQGLTTTTQTVTVFFNAITTSPLYLRSNTSNFTGSIDNVSVQLVRADLDQIEAKKCVADWIHTTALKDLNN